MKKLSARRRAVGVDDRIGVRRRHRRVSMANSDTFLTVLRKGIEKAAADASQPVVIEIADDDVNKQLSQIQNFIAAKVDAIIVNPVDTSATAPMTKLANDAGIPIVYVNRQPIDMDTLRPRAPSSARTKSIPARSRPRKSAACSRKPARPRRASWSWWATSPTRPPCMRTKDIHDVIASRECGVKLKIIDEQTADWDPVKAQDLMTNWIAAGHKPDAVISNNDNMAIGAINAMKAAGWDMKDVIVAGVDATQDALAYMKAGDLDVTVFQNAAGAGRRCGRHGDEARQGRGRGDAGLGAVRAGHAGQHGPVHGQELMLGIAGMRRRMEAALPAS